MALTANTSGKNRATAYSDFYKNKTDVVSPGDTDSTSSDDVGEDIKKKALVRRLKKMKTAKAS